ncbi:MAG: hypothetical protein JXQ73_07390 [Phycisphaerae bacterium]|nr:hypothetical protein [Phycisphaerae bacterium]
MRLRRLIVTAALLVEWNLVFLAPARAADWEPVDSGTSKDLNGVWGSGPADIFVVGDSALILHGDGVTWTPMDVPGIYYPDLLDIHGNAANDVYVAGDKLIYNYRVGQILRYDGSTWSTRHSSSSQGYSEVWATGPDDIFAVWWAYSGTPPYGTSTSGLIYWDDGGGGGYWTRPEPINGLWGTASDNVFAVGYYGVILRYDGSTWSTMTSGTTISLRDVWGTGPNDVFAVGYGGTILRYNGATWSPMTSGTTRGLYAVWGSAANDVFAAGESGTVLHYDGTAWSSMESGTSVQLNGVWGSGPSDVYAVGEDGTILHYGGEPPIPGQLMNPGFETPASTTGGWPTACGYWQGDYSEIVTAENGIAPTEGDRMLKFIATSGPNAPTTASASQVVQLVDLRGLTSQIAEGYTHARVRARFNRVTGDAQTDTRFTADIYAYAGEPNTFSEQWDQSSYLGKGNTAIYTDGDPNTWEWATAELILPVDTDFIAVHISATENVYNDTTEPEFDGHYGDAVTLELFRPNHVLTVNLVNGPWGTVEVDPNLSTYPAGTPVTLTAEPIEGKSFRHWELYDPCYPNDANYATYDANGVVTIVMNADRQATAVFKCGSGVDQTLPLLGVGVCVLGFAARRCRRPR